MEADTPSENFSERSIPLADLPDNELLQRWKQGDQRASEIFFERYSLRLVSMVANRLSNRFRGTIDSEDVVQSALGSFFRAAQQSRIPITGNLSLWKLLATFARRKMMRSIEKQSAIKRGGNHSRVSIEAVESLVYALPHTGSEERLEELLRELRNELSIDQHDLLDHMIAGQNQKQIAQSLQIDERTVRRRIARLRKTLAGKPAVGMKCPPPDPDRFTSSTLPSIGYREFVLGKWLGSGGFGKVYRAVMQIDGKLVAVKFLRKTLWKNREARQTFLREIEAAAQIDHPGVANYLGWGESPHGAPYIVRQWIDGTTLDQLGSLTTTRFIMLLDQVCDTLSATHHAGLVHGDLSPSNILVNQDDQVTLTDFGLSRQYHHATDDYDLTSAGGTLGFAAPEQISSAFGQITPKTDIYAVGGLIYWHLTGYAPHQAISVQESLADTISTRQRNVESTSSPLKHVMMLTLRKSPAERISCLAPIRRALDQMRDDG